MSFWRRSSQPISWLSTEETKPNTTKANNKRTKQSKPQQKNTQHAKPKQRHRKTKPKPKPTLNFKNCSHVSVYHYVQSCRAQHNIEQFRYLPSHHPDNHHCSDVVDWRQE